MATVIEIEKLALKLPEQERAKLSANRSVSSARASGGKAIASRKISSDVAMGKDYSLAISWTS